MIRTSIWPLIRKLLYNIYDEILTNFLFISERKGKDEEGQSKVFMVSSQIYIVLVVQFIYVEF